MNKIDKKNKVIFRRVAILNIATIILSIILWYRFQSHIGGLFIIISAWSSWVYMKMTKADIYIGQRIGYTKENIRRRIFMTKIRRI